MENVKKKIFGTDIVELYDYDLNNTYNFIKSNTSYLDDISIDEVKEIMFSYYEDIIILLKNGVLLVNGKEKFKNIRALGFMSAISIFAVSDDNIIICLTGQCETAKFINNNNYKYKKIIITPLIIVALTYEKEVKLFGMIVDNVVDYNNYIGVEDIGYVEEYDDIVVIKNDKVYSLFVEHDYSNEKPDVIISGELKTNKNASTNDERDITILSMGDD